MHRNPTVECELCKGKIIARSETAKRYSAKDNEYYSLTSYVPDTHNRVGMTSYVCDECYSNFPETVKKHIISGIENHIECLKEKKKKEYESYLDRIKSIDDDILELDMINKDLKNGKPLKDLTETEIYKIKYTHDVFSYHIQEAIKLE
ncbi:hypothetical protein ACR77J_07380 [Tissierella praeacuta]|uniref:hypothetical protein n=1 Tax=Tissierella praeacuta TaxID=43131 RepID=UPI003DA50D72